MLRKTDVTTLAICDLSRDDSGSLYLAFSVREDIHTFFISHTTGHLADKSHVRIEKCKESTKIKPWVTKDPFSCSLTREAF